MARLPVYNSQGGITTETAGNVRPLDAYSGFANSLGKVSQQIQELGEQWQQAKDEVETLDGKNKLMMGVNNVLVEAQNYNDWKTPEELEAKRQELTAKMDSLVPNVMSGFSNNRNAGIFQRNSELTVYSNKVKLDEIFRGKIQDQAISNLNVSADMNYKNFVATGSDSYKQSYFADIDKMTAAGFITREDASKMKLKSNDWNADFAYNLISKNPYAKVPDHIMKGIDGKQQASIRNFARTEQNRVKSEATQYALNDFFLNPTQDKLNRLYKLNPQFKASDKLSSFLEENTVNNNAITTIYGMSDALQAVKQLASIDTSTTKGKQEYSKTAANIGFTINKLHSEEQISPKDRTKLFNMIFSDMMNDEFKSKLANMPDLTTEWNKEFYKDRSKLREEYLNAEINLKKLQNLPNMQGTQELKDAEAKYQQSWKAYKNYSGLTTAVNYNRIQNAPEGVQQTMKNLTQQPQQMLKYPQELMQLINLYFF